MYSLIVFLLVLYACLLFYYRSAWQRIPLFRPRQQASISISVLIPARNEAANIGRLLDSLQQQDYPAEQYEIIVIDDHSTDDTAALAAQYAGVHVIRLQEDDINSYKKKALEQGVAAAKGQLIVTTDADCVAGKYWLSTIAAFQQQTNAAFIVAPVSIEAGKPLVEQFQALDFMILQGITGASVQQGVHSMCNGANMAYLRDIFYEVNGYSGIDHIASGDDMLLMHKIWQRYTDRIGYLSSPDVIIKTAPVHSWRAFLNQRIRWASKASFYDDKRIIAVLVLVYLLNLSLPVLLIAGFFCSMYWVAALVLIIAKALVEYPFVYSVARFFKTPVSLLKFLFLQPLHIGYTVIAGFLGVAGGYEWKGRKVR
ncbi:glycosyltransferase [Terrimonas ferruginea]|uniref:glycosyltransferase n=1 Tax=Terrimonas ferruginea TaxID=249 RepID=UPI000412E87A|nr:glycosyltransferase [Terrimonas ferruginea]